MGIEGQNGNFAISALKTWKTDILYQWKRKLSFEK